MSHAMENFRRRQRGFLKVFFQLSRVIRKRHSFFQTFIRCWMSLWCLELQQPSWHHEALTLRTPQHTGEDRAERTLDPDDQWATQLTSPGTLSPLDILLCEMMKFLLSKSFFCLGFLLLASKNIFTDDAQWVWCSPDDSFNLQCTRRIGECLFSLTSVRVIVILCQLKGQHLV